ncbi:LicD family protein [Actinobacillus equuli]|uniref:LPS biosynthesis protein n=1 Tax=Actinobacillus equuli TaxID=718 RepID=A0AAX3FK77_ACTEU|nr:LicD family protein [Actinobacillus equuli]AIZ80231.1 lipopolysaccharide cholinephosphotransferase [Actinobacillus equuli subsp. equuli]WGE44339.1 LicD family protein [Actinobacillus equuli subsp. equuli]VEE91540.1 LPS biosynthesis protein [Actinobacillus equuli]
MTTETIKLIQYKELNILREFIRICEKYNLTYYVLGGTLLGAVRHKGFIPWDDDIDIGMPRKDYNKLMELKPSEFNSPYKLVNERNTPNFTKAFMNLQDSSTKILMKYSNIPHEESLWIDIFPIDGLPKNPIKKWLHEKNYLFSRMLVQLSQFNKIVNQNKSDRPFIEKLIIKLASILNTEKLLRYETCQKYYVSVISKYDMSEYYAGNYTGAYKLKELVPADYFGHGVLLPFETIQVKVPSKYKEYLEAIYGRNYMQLPPENSRVPHQYDVISLGDNNE